MTHVTGPEVLSAHTDARGTDLPLHLAAIVANSDDAIVSKTLDGTILSWNDAATRIYGYTAEEAIGQRIDIIILDDEQHRAEELDIRAKITEGQRIDHRRTVRRNKDGRQVEISLSISPVPDVTGRIVAAAGFARDISEVARAFEINEYLAAIVANSDDAIVSKTLDGTILSWNDAATRMYGYTAEEATGRPIDIIILDDEQHRAEELDIRAKIAEGQRIDHYETLRRNKDGRQVEISLSISPVRDSNGRIVAAAGFARDISERRLFQANEYLAAIVANSDDAIVSKTLDGKILSWNDAATRMYGYTAEEAIGQPIDIIILDDEQHRAEELDILAKITEGQPTEHDETVRRNKAGGQIEISLSISPVPDVTGRIVAGAEIARDISERKRLEEERARATGLLERYVDFFAHDFKTPMQNILINAQEVDRLTAEGRHERVDLLLRRIVANSIWMNKRTEGLLRVSTLKGNRQVRTSVRTDRVFDEAYAILKSVDSFAAKATVERGPLPAVTSDETLMGFLFQNLLQNACKYGRVLQPVEVRAGAEHCSTGWRFWVADNGMGVRPGLREKIFDEHVRDPETDAPGTGIGLSFCRRIVEWHGGRIWVEPNVGHGSIFYFTIPGHDGSPT